MKQTEHNSLKAEVQSYTVKTQKTILAFKNRIVFSLYSISDPSLKVISLEIAGQSEKGFFFFKSRSPT